MHSWIVAASRRVLLKLLQPPDALIRILAGPPPQDEGHELDARCHWTQWTQSRIPEDFGAARARREFATLSALFRGDAPREITTVRIALAGCPARLYRPQGYAQPGPTLLYFHGGGWVIGDLDSYDAICRRLAARARVQVIALDYRLAPEHPFPAAYDDAIASFREVRARAEELGVDPKKLAVGGDSAGGNLAGAVAQTLRGAEGPCLQLLLYPVTDTAGEHPSYHTHGKNILTLARMRWFREQYLGQGGTSADPRVSLLSANGLSGVCPSVIATAGFDVLRDEGRAYAERLRQAGNRVEALHYPHLPHAFAALEAVSPAAQKAQEEVTAHFAALLR